MRPSWLMLAVACGCASRPAWTPAAPADLAAVRRGAPHMDVLLAIDRIEDSGDVAAAPHLLALQSDPERNLEQRARAAAALARLGFDTGESFCLAVLGALTPGSEASDRAHRLPRNEDRWAFARELALRPIRGRLLAAGLEPPRYSINFGAPDLARATAAMRSLLDRLPRLAPPLDRAALADRIPEAAPEGWPAARWQELRGLCLREAGS